MIKKTTNLTDIATELVKEFKVPVDVVNFISSKDLPYIYNCYWEQAAKDELLRYGVKKSDIENLTGDMLELVYRVGCAAWRNGADNL